MLKSPKLLPVDSKQEGQKSIGYEDAFLFRYPATFMNPTSFSPQAWRGLVASQPIASLCRDTLISSLMSLDWKISVRDSNLRDELAATVRHYTRLLEGSGYTSNYDFASHIEFVANDALTLPFGGICEVGRKGDSPNGRAVWIEPIDGATCFPTLNNDFPVGQMAYSNTVYFERGFTSRIYMSPRPELDRKGWGVAPPERVLLSLDMLSKGDRYYANLLLDIPPAGILDLGDMDKDSASEWADAYRAILANGGQDSFKIPILYEHHTEVKFLPLGKVPNDIMYDRITLRYAALVCAAYGMSLSDIGLQATAASGETLAGSIRQERRTRKTGYARLKKKLESYFNAILPPTLQFSWIDYDEELNVAVGRARLANATAWKQLVDAKMFSAQEGRLQTMQDGLVTISIPESIPENFESPEEPSGEDNERASMLGYGVPPSVGGLGEVKSSFTVSSDSARQYLDTVYEMIGPVLKSFIDMVGEDNLYEVKMSLTDDLAIEQLAPMVDEPSFISKLSVDTKSVTATKEAKIGAKKLAIIAIKDAYLDNEGIDFENDGRYTIVEIALDKFLNNLSMLSHILSDKYKEKRTND